MTPTYTTRKPARLFFDLETAANPENLALAPEPVIEAPSNYKDPVKIAEYIAEKTAAAKLEQIAKAALDPDYGKILSIGYAFGFDKPVTVLMAGDHIVDDYNDPLTTPDPALIYEYDLSEVDLIEDFWDAFTKCNGNCVGYNILGFDLPYLMRRSMALGVNVPYLPNLAKFRNEPVTDLMMILYNWGNDRYKGLKQVARLYGLKVLCPDVDGSKVATLDRDTLRAYQASDVDLVQQLFKKMNGVYFNL